MVVREGLSLGVTALTKTEEKSERSNDKKRPNVRCIFNKMIFPENSGADLNVEISGLGINVLGDLIDFPRCSPGTGVFNIQDWVAGYEKTGNPGANMRAMFHLLRHFFDQ